MDWFLYNMDLRHEKVKYTSLYAPSFSYRINTLTIAVKNYAKADILVF